MKVSHISDVRRDSSYCPDAFPINSNIIDDRIQLRANPVVLPAWKGYCSAVVALVECSEDLGVSSSLCPRGLTVQVLPLLNRPMGRGHTGCAERIILVCLALVTLEMHYLMK